MHGFSGSVQVSVTAGTCVLFVVSLQHSCLAAGLPSFLLTRHSSERVSVTSAIAAPKPLLPTVRRNGLTLSSTGGLFQEWLGGFREGEGGEGQDGEFVDSFERVREMLQSS